MAPLRFGGPNGLRTHATVGGPAFLEVKMQELIEQFNKAFDGAAKAEVKADHLWITVGTETLIIQLPMIVGGQSKPMD